MDRIREELPSLSLVDQKDLCLFIGPSGSAKTSLICFLRKKKMILRQERHEDANGNVFLGKEWVDTELRDPGFEIGNQVGGGVTKSISTDSIPGSFLVIGDTRGVSDPEGAVNIGVDIANAVTIQNAMKRTRTVRPVLVFSIGILEVARAQGFIDLIILMGNFFSPIADYFKSLTFFFTGGDPREKLMLLRKSELVKNDVLGPGVLQKFVNDIYQYVSENHSSCVVLLKDLVVSDAHGAEENRARYLELIGRAIAITDVQKVGCPLKSADKMAMQSKCLALKDEIVSSLTGSRLDLVVSPLGLMETLREHVALEEINTCFQSSFEAVQTYIQQRAQAASQNLRDRQFSGFLVEYNRLEAAGSALQSFVDVLSIKERLREELNALVKDFKLTIYEGLKKINDGRTLSAMDFLREIDQNLSALLNSSCVSSYADMKAFIESRIDTLNASCRAFLELFRGALEDERDLLDRFPAPFTHANRNAQSFIDFFGDFASLYAASKFKNHLQPAHLSCYEANSALLFGALSASYGLTMDENSPGLVSKIAALTLTADEAAQLCRIHFLLSLCYYPREDGGESFAHKHIQEEWGLLEFDKDLLNGVIEKLRGLLLTLDVCIARSDFAGMTKPLSILVHTKLDDEEFAAFQAQEAVPKIDLLKECVQKYHFQTRKDFESLKDRQSVLPSDVKALVDRIHTFAPCAGLDQVLFPSEGGGGLLRGWVSKLVDEIESFFGCRALSFRSIIQGDEDAVSDESVQGRFLNLDHMAVFFGLVPEAVSREAKAIVIDINAALSKMKAVPYTTDQRGLATARLLARVTQLEFILPSLRDSELLRLAFDPSENFSPWAEQAATFLDVLHRAVINSIVDRMNESKAEVQSALERKDSEAISQDLDKLKSYSILDSYLERAGFPTASEVYSKVRSELSVQIGSLKSTAESAAARADISTSKAIEEFFRHSSKYAHHFDIQFSSVADSLRSMNSKVADTLPGMVSDHLRASDFDAVKRRMVRIAGTGTGTGGPMDNEVLAECNSLISCHLTELTRKVLSAAEDSTEDAVTALREILPVASRAMVLSGVAGITSDPTDLLNSIYETCDDLFSKLTARIVSFLTVNFKFLAADTDFKLLCRFRIFDCDLNPHVKNVKRLKDAHAVELFNDRIAALERTHVHRLKDFLEAKLVEFLGHDCVSVSQSPPPPAEAEDNMSDVTNSDGMTHPPPNDLMMENLLRGVSSVVEADGHTTIFNDSVDFFEVKGILVNTISRHFRMLINSVKHAIRDGGKDLDTAEKILENTSKILHTASQFRFVKSSDPYDMKKNFDKQEQALKVARGEGRIVTSFTFDPAGIKNAHRFLQKARAEDFGAYRNFKDVIKAKFVEAKNQVCTVGI